MKKPGKINATTTINGNSIECTWMIKGHGQNQKFTKLFHPNAKKNQNKYKHKND